MYNHIVGHRSDPDGILSHAILRRFLNHDCVHYFADYGDIGESLNEVKEEERGNVIVADLSLGDEIEEESLFKAIRDNHNSFAWFDHHNPSINKKHFLENFCDPVVLSLNKCAAELINSYYSINDEYSNLLAHLGKVHDFERRNDPLAPLAYGLQDLIASGYELDDLVIDLSEKKVIINENFIEPYSSLLNNFKRKKEEAYQKLEASVKYETINDHTFVFAFADPILYMKLAPEYLKKNLDVEGVVVMYDNKPNVIIYGSGKIGKKIPIFCKMQGGGGRGHGGGFVLDHNVDQTTYRQDTLHLEEKLKYFFLD